MKLRPDQERMIEQARAALRRADSVLLQAPTGFGKTVLASYMLGRAAERGLSGYFVCHRRELVAQTAKTFDRACIPHGIIAAGHPVTAEPVQVCSIDTLKRRLDSAPCPDLMVWDEAHHITAGGWSAVREHYAAAKHVGLTATPQRRDGRGLGSHFAEMVAGPAVRELIDAGSLAQYRLYSVPGVQRDGIRSRMGDCVASDAERAMDQRTITGDIVAHWRKHAGSRLTIGFAVSVKHSQKLVDAFRSAGIPAAHLDANTATNERRNTLQALARNELSVVWNVGLFGEGYDLAANSGLDVAVGCVIDAAPTTSLSVWLQRCGRALRPQGRHAVILDHAGNAMQPGLGLPCEPREWTLDGKRKRKQSVAFPVRQCPECFAAHRPEPECPYCGHTYPVQERKVEESAGELEELKQRQARRLEVNKARTLEELKAIGRARGYKPGWAYMKHRSRKHA